MEPKKNPGCDIHRYRPLMLSFGLMSSLSIVLMAFQWKTRVMEEHTTDNKSGMVIDDLPPPVTLHEPVKPEVKPMVNPIIVEAKAEENTEPEFEFTFEIDPAETFDLSAPVDRPEPEAEPDAPFLWAETMPAPEGGMDAFYDLLRKNIHYPAAARRMNLQGKVFVQFIVGKDGKLRDIKVIRGIGGGCDEEAVRVLKLAQWKPGKQRGQPVEVKMTQPIHFSLE